MKRRTFLTAAGSGAVVTALPITDLGNKIGWREKGSLFDEIERSPPHDLEAEKKLLRSILNDNRAYDFVSDFLRPEHFFLGPHKRIFNAAAVLIERNQIADPEAVYNYLEFKERLGDWGTSAYLFDLVQPTVMLINASEYGHIIRSLYLKRELIAFCEDVANRVYRGDENEAATMQIEYAEQCLYDLTTMGEYEGGFQPFKGILDTVMKALDTVHTKGELSSVATSFRDLDIQLGGLHPSDIVVLAGRSAMNKGQLACDFAYNAANNHHHTEGREGSVVGLFSLSMSAELVAIRILSKQSNIPPIRIRKGEFSNEEFNRLGTASMILSELPIFIDDTPALTMSALRTRARRLKRQHNLGLVVVDYLKLITLPTPKEEKGESDQTRMIVARNLKTLGTELDVPVLVMDIVD